MKSDVVQTLRTRYFRQIFTLTLLAILPVLAKAERLPIKTYTTADGLAHNVINKIVRDSRGFLWFCTADGLSRFDGYSFTNYGTEQGLPLSIVNDILETREGEYWVATNGGLVRFNPQGTPKNQVVGANEVSTTTAPMFALVVPEDTDRHARFITALLEDSNRHIWCGTYKGLYRLDVLSGRLALTPVEIGMPNDYSEQRYINDIAEDAYGSIWIATPHGLYRRWPNGDAARYTTRDGMPADFIHDLLIDHERRLWVSTRTAGFLRLAFDQSHAKPSIAFTVVPRDLGQSDWINQLFETSEHKLWAATAHGLLEVFPNGNEDGTDYRLYTTTYGLSDHDISALGEDAGGNLWLGSANGTGLMRLAHNGFVTYGEPDGLACVNAIFGDRAGGVCFRGFVVGDKRSTVFEHRQTGLMSEANYFMRFGRFDGQRLTWFLPDVMKNFQGWVNEGVTLQSRTGEWWTANGLFHFPAIDNFMQLQRARPLEYFGEKSLLGPRQIWRLFEDSRDRIWVSIIFPIGNGLARWEPDSKSLHDLAPATNLPSLHDDLARSFEEDRAGNVWIGFNTGVARARGEQFAFSLRQTD